MVRVIFAIALALWLTGCSLVGSTPPKSIVEAAIALQLEQIQQELSQQLRLDSQPPEITIKRVKVANRSTLTIQDLPAYQITGTCDYTVKLTNHTFPQRSTPFEVFLQSQSEGKTWRTAYLKADPSGEPVWVTQRIPTETFE